MQLKPKNIRHTLALATCALLPQSPVPAKAAETKKETDIDYSILNYNEEGRVKVYAADFQIRRDLGDDESITANFILDSMTGATPNGAYSKGGKSASVTTASGTNIATVQNDPNALDPLSTFYDSRVGSNVTWVKPWKRTLRTNLSGNISAENDYEAYGTAATVEIDVNEKRTTFSLGTAFGLDFVGTKDGSTPEEMGDLVAADRDRVVYTRGVKNTSEQIIGFTQVVNKNTLFQMNLTYGHVDGYLSDPYKIVSIVEETTDDILGHHYEKRPDSRTRYALFTKYLTLTDSKNVVNTSYRFFQDDWDIKSHTVDFHFRHDLKKPGSYIQAHIRGYTQTAAYFYHEKVPVSVLATETDPGTLDYADQLPEYASADYRLNSLCSFTVGAKYGTKIGKLGELRLRLERMIQRQTDGTISEIASECITDYKGYLGLPDDNITYNYTSLNATIFQVMFTMKFD